MSKLTGRRGGSGGIRGRERAEQMEVYRSQGRGEIQVVEEGQKRKCVRGLIRGAWQCRGAKDRRGRVLQRQII